jgi:aspartyl-tRNA(Asn)/glutamyl-tRNA(Gln) amidotransferase subunit C
MIVCDVFYFHMTIDLKTIKHISKLSRISVDEAKAEKLAGDLNSIFKFIEKLNELKTDNVEPLTSVAETTLRLRGDEVKSKNIKEEIIKNSPKENKDFFVVPKVVE